MSDNIDFLKSLENEITCPLELKRCLYQNCRYWDREYDFCDFEDIRARDKNSSRSLKKYLENVKHNTVDCNSFNRSRNDGS